MEALTFGITASMCVTVACALLSRSPEFPYSSQEGEKLSVDDPFRSSRLYLDEFIATAGENLFKRVRAHEQQSKL